MRFCQNSGSVGIQKESKCSRTDKETINRTKANITPCLKILFAVSAALFLASLTEAGSAIAWGFLKPLSAILFIVFFIGQLLHTEVVKYDEECRLRLAGAKAQPPLPVTSNLGPAKCQNGVTLAPAH